MKKLLLLLTALLVTIGLRAENTAEITLGINYENGAEYSFSNIDGAVIFEFNRLVTVENAWIIPESGEKIAIEEVTDMHTVKFYYYCQIAPQIKELIKTGKITVGSKFKIMLEGIKDGANPAIIYGQDGTATIELIAPRLPATFVSVSKPNNSTIDGYYKPGDENAKITFTFSENVNCTTAKISYGNPEEDTFGEIDLPITCSENKIIADLGGINLNADQIKGNTSITIILGRIRTIDGTLIEGNIAGSPGAVGVSYNVKKKLADDVYGGFENTDIDTAEKLECYVSAPITFDGAMLTYTLNGEEASTIIPAKQITVTPEEDGGITLFVPIANLSFDAGKVTAEIINAQTEDGSIVDLGKKEYTSKGKIAPTICTSITPAPGVISEAPRAFVLNFNNSVTVESAVLLIGTDEIPLIVGGNVLVNNNTITITNLRFQLLGEFSFKLQVRDSKGYITYGETENYVTLSYSIPANSFTCSTISPEAGKVNSLKVLTLTFDDISDGTIVGGFDTSKEVTLKNEAGSVVATGTFEFADWDHPLNVILTLSQEVSAAGIYTLNIPEATVYNELFDDMNDDFGVSNGARYNPELNFTYIIGEVSPTTCSINPAPGEYPSLPTEIAYTFTRNVTVETALLYGTSPMERPTDLMSKLTTNNNVVTINLQEEDIAGRNQLYIVLQAKDITGSSVTYGDSEGYINVLYTKPIIANTFACVSINPVSGSVGSLQKFTLTFSNPNDPRDIVGGFDTSKVVELKNADNETVATGTFDFSGFTTPDAILTLSDNITAAGKYTLIIPEATVYNSDFDDWEEDFGVSINGAIYNPELTFEYTIVPTGIQNIFQDITGEVDVYTPQGILIRHADISVALKGLEKGIYIIKGKKFIVE